MFINIDVLYCYSLFDGLIVWSIIDGQQMARGESKVTPQNKCLVLTQKYSKINKDSLLSYKNLKKSKYLCFRGRNQRNNANILF